MQAFCYPDPMDSVKEISRPNHLENVIKADPFMLSFELNSEDLAILIDQNKYSFKKNGLHYFNWIYTHLLSSFPWSKRAEIIELLEKSSIPEEYRISFGPGLFNPNEIPAETALLSPKNLYELSNLLYSKKPCFSHHLGFRWNGDHDLVLFYMDHF